MAAITSDLPLHISEKPALNTLTAAEPQRARTRPEATEESSSENASKNENESDDIQYQAGVQRARAITQVWSKKTLWLMFGLLYLVSFIDMLFTSVQQALNPYITSAFGSHGLLAATSVISSILGGSSRLTLAKIIDTWGRIEGFMFMLLILVLGMIMKATCQNIETYVAAHTLYWVGHLGVMYVIDIMLADFTSLRNRMILYGINGTPTIASTFAGPRVADLFYTRLNFRWAYGAFAIIMFGSCIPVMIVMLWMQRTAARKGLLDKKASGRTWWQSMWFYFVEMDVVGIILITAAFSLILLPFSISAYAPRGWATAYIIIMEVLGTVCLPAFYVWERYCARVPFISWKYLKEPTVISSSLLYGVMFISILLSITTAGYVLNSYSLTSSIFSPLIGFLISYTGDFKWTAYSGVPIILLGTALLIPFRTPDIHVGILVMTQILNGLGSGIFATCGQLAVMAAVTHQEIAAVIAIWGLFGSIGAAIGLAIAGAMWNNILPAQLYERLPEASRGRTRAIFGSLPLQMSFADGTPEREAIVGAYGDLQRKMVIAGSCFIPVCLACIYFWRNINVKNLERQYGKQTAGTVF